MSLYDEIMALKCIYPRYGTHNAQKEVAELAKKYDDEIKELKFTINDLERKLKDDSFR